MWAELTSTPVFIGILNLTPDSFSDGGRFLEPAAALRQACSLVEAGARMLDVGAESTRPGAEPVSPEREWARLGPVLALLRRELPDLHLSLDTRHADVAKRGLDAGVVVINDVTGFLDPAMLKLAQEGPFGLIAMRSRREGTAFVMPPYFGAGENTSERAVLELIQLRDRLRGGGIEDKRVLLDPGFGFGTTYSEDLAIWEALPDLPARLAWPSGGFCLGVSRKRFLATRAGTPELPARERDGLTAAAHDEAATWGYRVFRTHAIG